MKRLSEYAEAEFLSLSDQEYKDLVDFECSHEGIRLEPQIPVHRKTEVPAKDMISWEISSIIFADMNDAMDVVTLINSKKRLSTHYGTDYRQTYLEETKEAKTVKEEKAYSELALNKAEALIIKAKDEENEYDNALKEYKEVQKKRTEIIDKVNNAISGAKAMTHKLAALKRDYMRYLKLSDGQAQIAFNFLLESRPDQRAEIESLKAEIAVELILGKQK